jgi:hypothetical protein
MGHLKQKYAHKVSLVRILASTSIPFRPTTVKMPNLALIETKPMQAGYIGGQNRFLGSDSWTS